MRFSGVWVLFLLVGTTFLFLLFKSSSKNNNTSLSFPDIVFHRTDIDLSKIVPHNRKMKETMKSYEETMSTTRKQRENANSLNMEDYPRFDPTPSSKAKIHAGPIEHGSPFMPYIPKPTPPTPPSRPKQGSSP